MNENERREFLRKTATDPYQAMIVHVYLDAWADGYEQARDDKDAHDLTHRQLRERALDRLSAIQEHHLEQFAAMMLAVGLATAVSDVRDERFWGDIRAEGDAG